MSTIFLVKVERFGDLEKPADYVAITMSDEAAQYIKRVAQGVKDLGLVEGVDEVPEGVSYAFFDSIPNGLDQVSRDNLKAGESVVTKEAVDLGENTEEAPDTDVHVKYDNDGWFCFVWKDSDSTDEVFTRWAPANKL